MEILQIALLVLAVVGVWAVVEIALTMRSARRDVERLTSAASEVIEQAQPVVVKLDGIADELEPAAKRALPLLEKTEAAVSTADETLGRVGSILDDVSTVSGAASSVTDAVKGVAESAASGVAGVVSRIAGARGGAAPARLDEPSAPAAEPRPVEEAAPTRYVDYTDIAAGTVGAQDGAAAGATDPVSDDAQTPEE